MMVVSTLLNSCVVVLTNSPKAVRRLRLGKLLLEELDLLLQILAWRCRGWHGYLPTLPEVAPWKPPD